MAHPISHTLDLAYGYHCTAVVARHVGDRDAGRPARGRWPARWINAFDPGTGCSSTRRSTRAASGTTRSGCCTTWPRASPSPAATSRSSTCSTGSSGTAPTPSCSRAWRPALDELAAGYALNRFEGLNNEPDMEAPWAYHYAGRPDRTAEVVHAVVQQQFGTGPRRAARQRRLRRADAPGTCGPRSGCSRSPGRTCSWSTRRRSREARIDVGDRPLAIETTGFRRARTGRSRRSTCSRSTSTASPWTGRTSPAPSCTAAAVCSSPSGRSRRAGAPRTDHRARPRRTARGATPDPHDPAGHRPATPPPRPTHPEPPGNRRR